MFLKFEYDIIQKKNEKKNLENEGLPEENSQTNKRMIIEDTLFQEMAKNIKKKQEADNPHSYKKQTKKQVQIKFEDNENKTTNKKSKHKNRKKREWHQMPRKSKHFQLH